MALDKLVDSSQLDSNLTSIANAIRTKGGTSAQMAFPAGFVSAVQAIPTGGITPTGTKNISISANGTTTEDVVAYANAEITVNVPQQGETLLASGDYVQTSDITGNLVIPITCTGTVKKVLVVKDSTTSGVGQTLAWFKLYDTPQQAQDALSYVTMIKYVNSSGTVAYSARSTITASTLSVDDVTNPTKITCVRYSNNYRIKADTYHWYIWG